MISIFNEFSLDDIENQMFDVRATIIANINKAFRRINGYMFRPTNPPTFAKKNTNSADLIYIISVTRGENGKAPTAYIAPDRKKTAEPICVAELDTDVLLDLLKAICKEAEKTKDVDF